MMLKRSLLRAALVASVLSMPAMGMAQPVQTSLGDFMENFVKPSDKLAKAGNAEALQKILQQLPSFAVEEDKAKWQEIVDKSLADGKPSASCRACHSGFKRHYAKQYGDRVIEVPADLMAYLKDQLK